MLKFDPTLVQR